MPRPTAGQGRLRQRRGEARSRRSVQPVL